MMRGRLWFILAAGVAGMILLAGIIGTRASFTDTETSTDNVLRAITNWYDFAWHWRKPITLSNGGGALTDFQVKLTVNTGELVSAGKMLSSGADIRFTQANGTSEIPYWVESGMNTSSTVIWVMVPSVPAGSSTIYLYYGNSGAAAASNGDNTFIFFDSFETDLSKWTVSGTGTASRVTSPVNNGSYSMQLANVVTAYANFTAQTSTVVEYDARVAQTNRVWEMRVEDSAGSSGPLLRFNSAASRIQYNDGSWNNTGQTYSANTWYSFKLNNIDTATDNYDIYIGGTLRVGSAGFATALASVSRMEFSSASSSSTMYIDLVKVRKFAATEPSSSIGAEE